MATPARRQPQQRLHPQRARVTARGLRQWAKFTDAYDNEVVVQESSVAPRSGALPACWVFCARNPKHIGGEVASPLLTKAQARKLIRGLQKFIESGEAA